MSVLSAVTIVCMAASSLRRCSYGAAIVSAGVLLYDVCMCCVYREVRQYRPYSLMTMTLYYTY